MSEILNEAAELYSSQDYLSAFKRYRELATQGSIPSQRFLGWMYFRGDGVNQDKEKALHWLSKAADGGDLEAMFGVARVYMSMNELDNAFSCYIKSAEKGFLPSIYWVGRFYRDGISVAQDAGLALEQFEKAAKQGHLHSMRELALMKIKGYKGILGRLSGLFLFAKFVVLTVVQGVKDPYDIKGTI